MTHHATLRPQIESYLHASHIAPAEPGDSFYQQVERYQHELDAYLEQPAPAIRWQYQVPELGEDGACSIFDALAAEPYDLTAILHGKSTANETLLQKMTALVNFYQQHSGSNWFGVYQKRVNASGVTVLVKLAYFGAASRAEFPLTPEFASISNNSSVGLSGKGRIINQVAAYQQAGGEYYTCDPKVKAEACLPILSAQNEVLGIVDSEAFAEQFFTDNELALLVAVVLELARQLGDGQIN